MVGWIDAQPAEPRIENVPVVNAAGRVLAEAVTAPANLPSFDCAAIDGVAVRAEETSGASGYNPLAFRLAPAAASLPVWTASLLNEGDRLPAGADAIVPLDHASLAAPDRCEIIEPVAAGSHVERTASQAARGASLAPAGRVLRPADIALLTLAGLADVPTIARPRVRVLVTGGEPNDPRTGSSAAALPDGDGPMLRVLIGRDGGEVVALTRIGRGPPALHGALVAAGADADIVLIVGSSGQGANDTAAAALAAAGELAFWGVALYPGGSTGMGKVGGSLVFLLPGAAVSCLWGYEFCAGRAIRQRAGHDPGLPLRAVTMRTNRKIVSSIGMTEVCPVRRSGEDSVEPIASFAAAGIAAAAQADGFVIVTEGSEGFAARTNVTVYLADGIAP